MTGYCVKSLVSGSEGYHEKQVRYQDDKAYCVWSRDEDDNVYYGTSTYYIIISAVNRFGTTQSDLLSFNNLHIGILDLNIIMPLYLIIS